MFIFYWPWASLLLPLPLIARVVLPALQKTNHQGIPHLLFPDLGPLKRAFSRPQQKHKPSSPFFLILLSLTWLCLVLSIMRPQLVDQFTSIQNEGYDLMLAVDISGSMRALDFSTQHKPLSRLDAAKKVVGRFVQERQGDRIGLILFGEQAYLQAPLTLDTLAIRDMLGNATSGMAGDGTAIGDAIGLAVRNLRERPEGSRVLLLLTDGEDTASSIPPLEAAKLAKQYGIRIYAIGIGKNGPVPYPAPWGGIEMVHVPLDENLLKEIAALTDGQYFRAIDPEALKGIYDKINTLEKTKANVREYLIQKPLFQYPLGGAGLFLLCLGLFPFIRRFRHGV